MPICFIMDFPQGTSAEQYDAVIEKMDLDGATAPGALGHFAGPKEDGGWRVVDIWESPEAFQEFAETKIGPLTAEEGIGEPAISSFEVAETRDAGRPRSDTAIFQVVIMDSVGEDQFAAMDAEITGGETPDGLVFHVNGPDGEGGWIVADGWESPEAHGAFMQERVAPVASAQEEVSPPKVVTHAVHNTLEPR